MDFRYKFNTFALQKTINKYVSLKGYNKSLRIIVVAHT